MGQRISFICCKKEEHHYEEIGLRNATFFYGPPELFLDVFEFLFCTICKKHLKTCFCFNAAQMGEVTEPRIRAINPQHMSYRSERSP